MDRDVPRDERIDEEAGIWCARAFGRSSEPFDERAFQDWIGSSVAHREAFDDMARTWCRLEGLDPPLRVEPAAAMAAANDIGGDEAAAGPMLDRRRMLAAAAVGVLAVGGYAYYDRLPRRYATDIGQQSLVRLEDGSRITVDGATTVRLRLDKTSRTVWLDSGRASFQVAHDPSRPFSVHVRDKIVVAVGTGFSVERLQGQVRANLHSGRIDVVDRSSAGGTGRYRLLNAGDRFIAHEGSAPIITHDNSDDDRAWTKGVLDFDNEALPVTVERMNRYSTVQVVLAPGLEDDKVSGVFKVGETEKFVAAACELLNLHAEQVGNTIRLAATQS
jgi:transmembrane sensor